MAVSFEEWLKGLCLRDKKQNWQKFLFSSLFPSIFKDGYFATVVDLNKDTNKHINK